MHAARFLTNIVKATSCIAICPGRRSSIRQALDPSSSPSPLRGRARRDRRPGRRRSLRVRFRPRGAVRISRIGAIHGATRRPRTQRGFRSRSTHIDPNRERRSIRVDVAFGIGPHKGREKLVRAAQIRQLLDYDARACLALLPALLALLLLRFPRASNFGQVGAEGVQQTLEPRHAQFVLRSFARHQVKLFPDDRGLGMLRLYAPQAPHHAVPGGHLKGRRRGHVVELVLNGKQASAQIGQCNVVRIAGERQPVAALEERNRGCAVYRVIHICDESLEMTGEIDTIRRLRRRRGRSKSEGGRTICTNHGPGHLSTMAVLSALVAIACTTIACIRFLNLTPCVTAVGMLAEANDQDCEPLCGCYHCQLTRSLSRAPLRASVTQHPGTPHGCSLTPVAGKTAPRG